ncbi:hypothetical protein [Helicobacter burdigaliensis]
MKIIKNENKSIIFVGYSLGEILGCNENIKILYICLDNITFNWA